MNDDNQYWLPFGRDEQRVNRYIAREPVDTSKVFIDRHQLRLMIEHFKQTISCTRTGMNSYGGVRDLVQNYSV